MAGQAPALSPSSAVAEAVADKEGERENRRQIVEHAAVYGSKSEKSFHGNSPPPSPGLRRADQPSPPGASATFRRAKKEEREKSDWLFSSGALFSEAAL